MLLYANMRTTLQERKKKKKKKEKKIREIYEKEK